jgi:hypothetical protein
MLKVHPYLNGQDLGEKISGWVSVRYDITPYVKAKREQTHRGRGFAKTFGPAVWPGRRLSDFRRHLSARLSRNPTEDLPFSLHAEGDKKGSLSVESHRRRRRQGRRVSPIG